ncbi:MAG: 3-phosphoshikimate 1-carboxyvinyltransferase [Sphingomicrobium sp.]
MSSRLRASPGEPLSGIAVMPGDKSTSHRALILGALAEGETRITGLLESDDVAATIDALRAFGIRIEREGDTWRVIGGEWRSPCAPIDCGNSGSTARLVMGAAAGFPISTTLTGDESLRRRPMDRMIAPLTAMGARIEGGEHLPLTIHGGDLRGIEHVNRFASAQVKTAVLLAGLRASGEVSLIEPEPSRDHGEIMLREFGCAVETAYGVVRLGAQRRLRGTAIAIGGDPSSAAFLWTAAAIVPGSAVCTPGVLVNPLRTGLLDALAAMGGEVSVTNRRLQSGEWIGDVRVAAAPLSAISLPAERVPAMIDEYPLAAVAAACAAGTSRFDGLAELRAKESDRLAAIVAGLTACGVAAHSEGDSLVVTGRAVPGSASIDSGGDHRIAMAMLTLGLAARRPVTVDGAEMIATSFPGFAHAMRSIGAEIDELE